jgi:hypothetical protein
VSSDLSVSSVIPADRQARAEKLVAIAMRQRLD